MIPMRVALQWPEARVEQLATVPGHVVLIAGHPDSPISGEARLTLDVGQAQKLADDLLKAAQQAQRARAAYKEAM